MRCYFTGEECDCGGELDTECPHEEMEHEDELLDVQHDLDDRLVEYRFMAMSAQLDKDRDARQ